MLSRLSLLFICCYCTSIQAAEILNSTLVELYNSTLHDNYSTADQSDVFSTMLDEENLSTPEILAIVLSFSCCCVCIKSFIEDDCNFTRQRRRHRTGPVVPEEDETEETVVPEAVGVELKTGVQEAIDIATSPSSLASRREIPPPPPLQIAEPQLQDVAPAVEHSTSIRPRDVPPPLPNQPQDSQSQLPPPLPAQAQRQSQDGLPLSAYLEF